MPTRKERKQAVIKKALARYSGGTIALSANSNAHVKFLTEQIQTVPERLLENPMVMEVYADRLKKTRKGILPKRKGLSLEEAGRTLGISAEALRKKETGAMPVDRDDLLTFCLLYQVTPDYLLGRVTDPSAYLVTPVLSKAMRRSGYTKKIKAKRVTVPISVPPESVQARARLVIYKTCEDPELFSALMKLASASHRQQENIIRKFEDLRSIRTCPIEEKVQWALTDEFKESIWFPFTLKVRSGAQELDLSDALDCLVHLGASFFDCLDFMARVAISSDKIRDSVKFFIPECLDGKDCSHAVKMTDKKS